MTGVLEYAATVRVKTTADPSGRPILTEAGQAVEGSAAAQKRQVS